MTIKTAILSGTHGVGGAARSHIEERFGDPAPAKPLPAPKPADDPHEVVATTGDGVIYDPEG